ncbi:hypothetical protein DYI24_19100 [Rhodopseudomonas sp. BR0C11]|uniref:hypothetical protein n=1 Tax=Rhodopseudomonas sp. BR0C11 TaxID=2269370 RepID=UPI0013E0987B|nr:hypothetical protein [Rhodopseudomonas sp. BR0C11]NEV79144.1 hypothetical protein [Rhodopseudomonas sp. BR0C11]
MPSAYHMVHYRKHVSGDPKKTLEGLCRTALSAVDASGASLWKRVGDRFFDVPQENSKKVLLNKVADLKSAVFGEMCLVQSDGMQALLELTTASVKLSELTTAEIFKLQEASAPRNSQFIRGMVYWLCIKDHVLFVKTQSMTAELLRQYIEWLLKDAGSVLPSSATVKLQAEFDRATVGGDIGEIKSVRVSGNAAPYLMSVAQPELPAGITKKVQRTARKIADRLVEMQQALPIVEALFGKDRANSLVESLGPNEYLAVDASVKIRGSRTVESREKMQELANEVADLTDGKVQVEGSDGKVSDDDAILRTKMPFDLPHEGSNFLNFENVADQLQVVYSRFVADGKIT